MGRKVGIVAVAQTKYEESKPALHLQDVAYEAVKKVLAKSGLKFTEDGTGIDATISCSQDHWDGWTISSKNITDVAGGHLRPEEKVAGDGAYAAYYACLNILSGHHDCVLVIAHTKESQVDGRLIENFGVEPLFGRMLGLDFLSAGAIQAQRYMHKWAITPEQCAMVVVKNRGNARLNPCAQAPMNLQVEDVLASEMLSSPIRLLDTKPVSDGACAIVLAEEEKAKRWTDRPVWIEGMGSCYDSHHLGDRDLAEPRSLVKAARQAYRMAGIADSRKEIDVVELSEYYSYQELLWSEGLGFSLEGEGGKLIESGATQIGGELPINPSGGLLSGVPVNVAGLNRVAEAALQIKGEAEQRQVAAAKVALAHGTMGICGQNHCVIVLKGGN
jgi:acetyl-CoA C-acetyltransferase